MTTKFTDTTQRVAEDEGEFSSPAAAASWVAGAVLAFHDAEEIRVDIQHGRRRDGSAPGSFMWSGEVWSATVSAYWPKSRVDSPAPASIDMTPVAHALVEVEEAMEAGGWWR